MKKPIRSRARASLRGVALACLAAPLLCGPAQAADAQAGQKIATTGALPQVPACVSCHGADGMGMAAFPRLAGAGAGYLQEQLAAFAGGERVNATMAPIAKALSEADRANVAAYFASLPVRQLHAPSATTHPDAAWLAMRGQWAQGVPACAQCHGPDGHGVGNTFPPLAGLPAAYIVEQITAWQQGKRQAGPLGLMQAVASKLRPAQTQAIADYYAAYSATPAAAPASAAAPAVAAATGAKP